jgi:hypothetical protein
MIKINTNTGCKPMRQILELCETIIIILDREIDKKPQADQNMF